MIPTFLRRGAGKITTLAVLLTMLSTAGAVMARTDDKAASDDDGFGTARADFASVALDLALIQKIRADELFIRDGSCESGSFPARTSITLSPKLDGYCKALAAVPASCPIARKYCDAFLSVDPINPDSLPAEKQNTRSLLIRDIEYRLLLLDQRLSFWGAARSLTPSIPIQHVRTMESLLRDFEKQALEMLDFLAKIEQDADSANRLKAYAEQVRGQFQAESVRETKAEVIRLENQRTRDLLESRVDTLELQRQRLQAEAESLRAEADNIANRVENALMNAVASSMGAPPGLLDAVQQGDVKAAAISALSNSAVQSEITTIVKGFGESTQQFVELYQQGEELHRKFQDTKATLEGAKDFLRKPSADKLLRLGTLVSPYLPPEQQRELQRVVDETAPVLSLVDTVRTLRGKSPSEVCRALESNTLVSGQLGLEDKAACGLLELSLPKACNREALKNPTSHCRRFGLGDADSGLCQALQQGCSVQDTLAEHVNDLDRLVDNFSGEIEQAVVSIIDDAGDQYREVFTDAMRRVVELNLDDQELYAALDEILRLWSRDAVDFILARAPAPQREKALRLLAKHLKVELPADASDDAKQQRLAEALAARGLTKLRGETATISVAHGKLQVVEPGSSAIIVSFDAKDFLGRLSPERIDEKYVANGKSSVRRAFQKLANRRGKVRQALLRHVSPDRTEALVQSGIEKRASSTGTSVAAVRREVWTSLARNDNVATVGRDLIVGRTVAVDLRAELPLAPSSAPAPSPEPAGASGPKVEQALAEQAVKRALDAALPGAGVALDVLQGLAVLNANIERQQRVANDSVRIALQMIEAQEAADDSLYQSILAEKDEEIAAFLREAAARQLQFYNFGIKQNARNAALARSKIKLRRALTFYAAERLREEYDLFSRSMGLWGGYLNQPSNTVSQLIRSDPRNLRLALDPQIHLFGWLNREGEATRTDVDRLMLHWRQLVRLSRDLCQSRGCTPGAGRLGQTAQTKMLRLSEILPEHEYVRFQRWQSGATRNAFRAPILIHPALRGFPPAYRNLRFVDLRAGWLDYDESLKVASGVTLRHPGTAAVAGVDLHDGTRVAFNREVMLPRRTSSFDVPAPYDLERLRNRWQDDNDREAGIFEGYGLYTTLELTVHPTPEALTAEDLAIRIAFAYSDPENVVTEADFLAQRTSPELPQGLKIDPFSQTLCIKRAGEAALICQDNADLEIPDIATLMLAGGERRKLRDKVLGGERTTAAGQPRTLVEVKSCHRAWPALRREIRDFVTAEKFDEISDQLQAAPAPQRGYRELAALQQEIDTTVKEQLALVRHLLAKREPDLAGCPHPLEES